MNLNAIRSSLLGIASLALGAIFACALPFVALATAAARSLPASFAYGIVALTWLVDQTLGFTVRHYPRDASTFAWGAIIGVAVLGGTFAARRAPTFTLGFVLAFVVEQGVLVGYGALQHVKSAFAPTVIGEMALVNVVSLAILVPLAFAPGLIARTRKVKAGMPNLH